MRYAYPVEVREDPDGFVVSCPDVPEMHTDGANREEALREARDALISALAFYTDDGKPLPRPSPAHGRPLVSVTVLEAAKLALHDAMVTAGVSNMELAAKLGTDEKAVRRLRDPLHRSHIGQIEAALAQLGRRLDVSVEAA
jgi:antitoxin HicB